MLLSTARVTPTSTRLTIKLLLPLAVVRPAVQSSTSMDLQSLFRRVEERMALPRTISSP